MTVSAIIVTRGDVDLEPVLASLPDEWEKIVWDNGKSEVDLFNGPWARKYGGGIIKESWPGRDLMVYGRYAAIEHASHEVIYVQDDDCVVSDPRAIAAAWMEHAAFSPGEPQDFERGHVVCNMPANFRHTFYQEHSLVGFGAAFHRSAPARAFSRFMDAQGRTRKANSVNVEAWEMDNVFLRTCDIVFTTLTPRVLVDIEYEDLPWASAENRMWKQTYHREERKGMLELAKEVRDLR